MKIGLLSDIHGNVNALRAVLESVRYHGVEKILYTGDTVGYYYEPGKCLDLLLEWKVESIRGNHEDMLFRLVSNPSLNDEIRKQYGSGLTIALKSLRPEHIEYLAHLPEQKTVSVQDKTFLLCHGSPWDNNQYIYPDADNEIFQRCVRNGIDYVVLGHTHYQLAKVIGSTIIINPGSVGQPRGNRRGTAQWTILDISTGGYQFFNIDYDNSSVIAQVMDHDPEVTYLQNILRK